MSPSAVQIFKRKLTNLSSANPQLWISRLKADLHFDLKEMEDTGGFSCWNALDKLLSGEKKISICPISDPRNSETNGLSLKIANIFRKQKLIYQERGVDELFISYPFVLGQWPDGSWVRTPFLLVPAKLERGAKEWILNPSMDEAFINPSFLLAYSFHFKRPLDEDFYEKGVEITATDATDFLTRFYNKIKQSQIDILFNQDLFLKQIIHYSPIKKGEMPSDFKPGMLKLSPNFILGLFPQGDSLLVPDFEYLESNEVTLDEIFLKTPESIQIPLEKNIFCPLPMDGSQEDAIRKIKAGQSLVVQGPPGTGKSQLIANLMADAMGSKKSVLLVCQKRVALEVVQKRLNEVGLGQYVGLWSDFKKDRAPVYAQMAQTIQNLEEAEAQNQNLDTVLLERKFGQACNQLEQITQNLESWKAALFDSSLAGTSVRELYLAKEYEQKSIFKSNQVLHFKLDEWNQYLLWLNKYWDDLWLTLGPDSNFRNRRNWFLNGETEFSNLPEAWKSICRNLNLLYRKYKSACLTEQEKKPFAILSQKKVLIEAILMSDNEVGTQVPYLLMDFKGFIQSPQYLEEINRKWKILHALFSEQDIWPENLELKMDELSGYLDDIKTTEQHLKFKWIRPFYIALNKKAKKISILESKFKKSPFSWEKMKSTLEITRKMIPLSNEILKEVEYNMDLKRFNHLKERHDKFLKDLTELKIYQSAFFQLSKLINQTELKDYVDYIQVVKELKNQISEFENELSNWNSYFNIDQSGFLLANFKESDFLTNEFNNQKLPIWRIDQQLANLPGHWVELTKEILEFNWHSNSKEDVETELKNCWNESWVSKIEMAYPSLSTVSSSSWELDLTTLRNSIEEKEKLSSKILQLRISENTYKGLEFNRLGNRTSYRNLLHQVSKKRMRQPLRKLWEEHEEEIKQIMPAWLATPESISATWPIESKFDLIIFDESSQCFAEKGIPACYRGNQIVVVGDEMQLPPNQIFSSRWEDESGEDGVFTDQNSLLDLAQQFLPQVLLKGHYRSQFPELLAFSNKKFYQSKLEFFPMADTLGKREPALFWKKVNGIWKDQQNLEEARQIANELFPYLDKNPTETLGIITFNARQQQLIEKEIEKESIFLERTIPDWLFIKNIENVQGDERDHIWFSIAYAKNEEGKVIGQFGSLSQDGGENRLNVAITRARKSIHIFSSIVAQELPLSESSPKGPKLLQEYLSFAFNVSHGKEIDFQLPQNSNAIGFPMVKENDIFWILRDGSPLYANGSTKDFFGYKFISLSRRGYKVRYQYSRRMVLE